MSGELTYKPLTAGLGLSSRKISAVAVAEVLQKTPLCVLQTGASSQLAIAGSGSIYATGCAVHANGDINVAPAGLVKADAVQAVGSIAGPVSPIGQTGALPIPDPFASMVLTPGTPCSTSDPIIPVSLPGGTLTLSPGVHCAPITILQGGTLILQPGDHYFYGPLAMMGSSTLRGDDVDLIFAGANVFKFAQFATVELTARKTGPRARFLLMTSRDNTGTFTIASGNVRQLLGTLYIPNANLVVDTGGNVAQDSAWSVIVAKSITLKQNPSLHINSNYAGSGVPVPAGVGPSRGAVLTR